MAPQQMTLLDRLHRGTLKAAWNCERRGSPGDNMGGHMQSELGTDAAVRAFARAWPRRIVEVHVERLATVADVASLHAAVVGAIRRTGNETVICADHRLASPLSAEVADAWSRAMRRAMGRPTRRAILLDPSNMVYNLQLERIVQCAGIPARLFADIDEFLDWVGEALAPSERDVLRDLFSDQPPVSGIRLSPDCSAVTDAAVGGASNPREP